MMKKIVWVGLGLSAAILAWAADAAPGTHDFLAADAVDFRAVVSAPPADDSVAGRADQEIAVMLDTNRSPGQVALAKYFENYTAFTQLKDVLGDWCTPETLPLTASFFEKAKAESRPLILAAKENWNRARPYTLNPRLRPAVARPANTSYPSGHSFSSSLDAVLLSSVFPEHAADWEKEAQLVRWSRLYGGAHYPNDVSAGQLLGEAAARAMLTSAKTQEAIKAVRAEILTHLPK